MIFNSNYYGINIETRNNNTRSNESTVNDDVNDILYFTIKNHTKLTRDTNTQATSKMINDNDNIHLYKGNIFSDEITHKTIVSAVATNSHGNITLSIVKVSEVSSSIHSSTNSINPILPDYEGQVNYTNIIVPPLLLAISYIFIFT